MNTILIYLLIQLWTSAVGVVAINKYNKTKIDFTKNTFVKVLKGLIPFYYLIQALSGTPSKELQIKEVKENSINKDDLNYFFSDKHINYDRKKYLDVYTPKDPYQSKKFEERNVLEGNIVIENFSEEHLENRSGITPFVERNEKKLSLRKDKTNTLFKTQEELENYVFNAPIEELQKAYEMIEKAIDFRKKNKKNPTLVYKKDDIKAA